MTPQECLVAWMEAKSNYMKFPEYFNEEDKKDLLALDEEVAIRICASMYDYYKLRDRNGSNLLHSSFCPFCYLNSNFMNDIVFCTNCTYSYRHGSCSITGSDWRKAIIIFKNIPDEAEPLQEFLNTTMSETLDEFVNSRLTPGPDIG